ncbi:hypothetical protein [Allofournierella massiliensis]|uniref:hypothetical protein n=1 Tax=Allofournierella massiliensis TaxID=1650663 RepID=UPI00104AA81F|nr:hypothetical protein [Fournierella massiliensis]
MENKSITLYNWKQENPKAAPHNFGWWSAPENFREMNQKAQLILGGLARIFGKYHGNFGRDTPPEPLGVNCAVLPKKRKVRDRLVWT